MYVQLPPLNVQDRVPRMNVSFRSLLNVKVYEPIKLHAASCWIASPECLNENAYLKLHV